MNNINVEIGSNADKWVCKHYPICNGAGLGFDIHKVRKTT